MTVRCLLYLLAAAACLHAQVPQEESPPFDWDQRWHHYLQRTYSWQRMGLLAADTAFEHWTGDSGEWGRGSEGLGSRYGGGFGSRIIRNSIELGAGAALGEDTRFRPSGAATLGARVRYAALQAFTADRGGQRRFAYSRLAATIGGCLVTTRWQGRPLTTPRLAGRFADGYLSHLENSLLAEFGDDLKAVGLRVRKKVFGK
jgi:hypothetical protein